MALDASGALCSAALLDGPACLAQAAGGDSRQAARTLPPLVQRMLAAHGAGLDAVAVAIGPGSFTGLRASIALAHGIAIGAGIPVIGVSVPEAILEGVDGPAWVALDSRRAGRVFLCRSGAVAAEQLDSLPMPSAAILVVGDAAAAVADALQQAGAEAAGLARAVDPVLLGRVALRRLAGALPPCPAVPIYVEPPQARAAIARTAPA